MSLPEDGYLGERSSYSRSQIGGAAVMVALRELLPVCTHLISGAQPEGCLSLLVGQRAALGEVLDVPILPPSSGALLTSRFGKETPV